MNVQLGILMYRLRFKRSNKKTNMVSI